jgi:hypothetical protein
MTAATMTKRELARELLRDFIAHTNWTTKVVRVAFEKEAEGEGTS